jgi:hypothetical protein
MKDVKIELLDSNSVKGETPKVISDATEVKKKKT